MDLIDRMREISNNAPRQLEHIKTEEATKNAFIMPFIQALGYNVFDPSEVVPEFTADMSAPKKGEKGRLRDHAEWQANHSDRSQIRHL